MPIGSFANEEWTSTISCAESLANWRGAACRVLIDVPLIYHRVARQAALTRHVLYLKHLQGFWHVPGDLKKKFTKLRQKPTPLTTFYDPLPTAVTPQPVTVAGVPATTSAMVIDPTKAVKTIGPAD